MTFFSFVVVALLERAMISPKSFVCSTEISPTSPILEVGREPGEPSVTVNFRNGVEVSINCDKHVKIATNHAKIATSMLKNKEMFVTFLANI